MNTCFELFSDERGRVSFALLDGSGEVLLEGLPCKGRIAAQTEVMRTRESLPAADRLVPHKSSDGKHFVVLKNKDGDVLARSREVASATQLDSLISELRTAAAGAAIIDHS